MASLEWRHCNLDSFLYGLFQFIPFDTSASLVKSSTKSHMFVPFAGNARVISSTTWRSPRTDTSVDSGTESTTDSEFR
eukprot:5474750-Amphidinium_carterae.1